MATILISVLLVFGVFNLKTFAQASNDIDQDGYPDLLELVGQDRIAFADWFAAIAESQFYGISKDWDLRDQDCSGLLRYAFVQALTRKNHDWWTKFVYLPHPHAIQPQRLIMPLPLLDRSAFRQTFGTYRSDDVSKGRFVKRVGAKYLALYSSTFVTKDVRQAKRGDLMFFLRPGLGSYHSMVYLGLNAKAARMVVYHTGGSVTAGRRGEVRLLSIETLMKHPDAAFHPIIQNPNFLGFYRWKILL